MSNLIFVAYLTKLNNRNLNSQKRYFLVGECFNLNSHDWVHDYQYVIIDRTAQWLKKKNYHFLFILLFLLKMKPLTIIWDKINSDLLTKWWLEITFRTKKILYRFDPLICVKIRVKLITKTSLVQQLPTNTKFIWKYDIQKSCAYVAVFHWSINVQLDRNLNRAVLASCSIRIIWRSVLIL